MKRDTLSERHCPVARASAELVDGWTFLILRELQLGNRRFDAIGQQTGMNPRSLSTRLGALVECGILEKRALGGSKTRFEYWLTAKGEDLWPVLIMLKSWGERWADDFSEQEPPLRLYHGEDRHLFHPRVACSDCGELVSSQDLEAEYSDGMIADREQMRRLNRR